MKTIFNTLFITAAAVFAFSCEKPANDNITPSEENLVELTLTVGADTKTQLGGEKNTSIIWQENDKLIVFDGTANREFAIKDFEPGKNSAVFTGLALPAEKYYVVHSTAEGSEPVFTVPDEGDPYVTGILVANVQKAVKGSYDPAAFASVGIAEVKEGETDLSVQMWNTCSLVKVSLKSSNIKTIEISTTDENKYLTANCKCTIKEYPATAAQSDRYLSAVLDSESAMEPGDYYLAMIPRKLTNVSVTYTKTDGSSATVTSTMPAPAEGEGQQYYNFERSKIVPLGIDDTALEYVKEEEPQYPDPLTVTVDFTSQPFTTNIVKNTSGSYTLSQGGFKYEFSIYSSKNFIKVDGGLQMNVGGSSNASYIKLPVVPEMSLSKVYFEITNGVSANGKKLYINTTNNQDTAIGLVILAQTDTNESLKHTFTLTGSDSETQYWLCAPSNKVQISKLVLTYIK